MEIAATDSAEIHCHPREDDAFSSLDDAVYHERWALRKLPETEKMAPAVKETDAFHCSRIDWRMDGYY